MANIGTLTAHIGIDNMGLNRGLTQAQGRFSQFSAGAMKNIAKIGGAFAALGAAVGALAVFRSITKTGIDFEQTMTTVAGVMRATADESKRLTAAARKMGETTEWSASEAGGALQFLGMAGFEANKAIKALPGTLDLATAGQIGLGRAADIATNALTAMGLEVEELERVNDVFVGTITRSNTNMEMMAESFKYAAPVARAYGYSIEKLSGLIGMLGNAGIQGCYSNDTDVLTKRGWLHWSDVTTEDEFATRNPSTAEIEYQKSTKLIRYGYKGKMYLVQNRNVDQCVTPDHRMWIKRRDHDKFEVLSARAVVGKNVAYETGGLKWRGEDIRTYDFPAFEQYRGSWTKNVKLVSVDAETWAAFLGWYIAEGSCDYYKGTYRITISQNDGQIKEKMRDVLQKLPWKLHDSGRGLAFYSEQLYREISYLGKAPDKHIPSYAKAWSPRLLCILLNTLIEGDGDSNGAYYTSSPQLRDDVSEIALKLGYAVSSVQCGKIGDVSDQEDRVIQAKYNQWKVNIRKKQLHSQFYPCEYRGKHGKRLDGSRSPGRSEWIDYDGEVFCAEVPNHLLIVRRNGKVIVSGNSMAGTQLAMAFSETNKVAKKFGVEGGDFVDVLEQLREKGIAVTDVMEAFGKRSGRAAGVLYEATDATREFQETLGGVQGEAKRLADVMRSTVGASFKELKSVVESLALDVFEVYRDELKGFVVDTTEWIRENKDSIVGFVESIKTFLGGAMEVISSVATLLGKLGLGFADFFKTVESNAVDTANSVAESGERIRESLNPPGLTLWQKFWEALKTGWWAVGNAMQAGLGFAIQAIGTLFAGLLQFILDDVIWGIMKGLNSLGMVIEGLITRDFAQMRGGFQELGKNLEGVWVDSKTTILGTIDAWGKAWKDMTDSTWRAQEEYYRKMIEAQKRLTLPPGAVLGGFIGGGVSDGDGGGGGRDRGAILTMPVMPAMPTEGLAEFIARVQNMVAEYKTIQENRMAWMYGREEVSTQEYLAFLEQKLAGETAYSDAWMSIQQQIENVKGVAVAKDRAEWAEQIAAQENALNVLLAGYDTFWQSMLDLDMTGAERRRAIFESVAQAFMDYSTRITKKWIKDTLLQKTVTESAERSKLAAVATGAMGRIAWAIKEGAAAIASAAKSIYSAVAKIFEAHAWIPFAGVAIAAGFVGAMMATMGKFKKFHEGGLVGDEVLGIFKKKEYVVREPAVRSVGIPALEYINRTGHLPGGGDGAIQLSIGDVTIGGTGTPRDFFLLDEFKDAVIDLVREKLRNRELEM